MHISTTRTRRHLLLIRCCELFCLGYHFLRSRPHACTSVLALCAHRWLSKYISESGRLLKPGRCGAVVKVVQYVSVNHIYIYLSLAIFEPITFRILSANVPRPIASKIQPSNIRIVTIVCSSATAVALAAPSHPPRVSIRCYKCHRIAQMRTISKKIRNKTSMDSARNTQAINQKRTK